MTSVFVCGPGYSANNIDIRDRARKALTQFPAVHTVYGEEIEKQGRYKRKGWDLQTLETVFAHDVDFTLLILESPGAIAELGTFTQMPGIVDRLYVLLSQRFFRAESYIARGPLSILAKRNPNSVIYFDADKPDEMIARVLYPLTFYKYAHFIRSYEFNRKTKHSQGANPNEYQDYIRPIRACSPEQDSGFSN